MTEANGRPPRNFGQWPTAQRWPTAPYQQATEFKPPQQVPSGKPPGQDIFRRQQTTGQQQPPPKGYTGSRVVQPTTTKQLIKTVGPTGATAMTVAVPQPPAIGEQLPAASRRRRAATCRSRDPAGRRSTATRCCSAACRCRSAYRRRCRHVSPDGRCRKATIHRAADGCRLAVLPPFLWPPPVTWLPAMDEDDCIWQQQPQRQHFCVIAASEEISEEAIDAFIANARLQFDQRKAKK